MDKEQILFKKPETRNLTKNIKKGLFASAILFSLVTPNESSSAENETKANAVSAGSGVQISLEVLPMIRCSQDFSECLTNESCATGYDPEIKKYTDTEFCKIDVIKDESNNTITITILDNLDNVHIDSSTPFLRK